MKDVTLTVRPQWRRDACLLTYEPTARQTLKPLSTDLTSARIPLAHHRSFSIKRLVDLCRGQLSSTKKIGHLDEIPQLQYTDVKQQLQLLRFVQRVRVTMARLNLTPHSLLYQLIPSYIRYRISTQEIGNVPTSDGGECSWAAESYRCRLKGLIDWTLSPLRWSSPARARITNVVPNAVTKTVADGLTWSPRHAARSVR
ncbi:hypothetical protein EVAR_46924_1 [Eumeta japonica]|uniref:Uncharacterized protein n=1 Tax=Eumeta variegata TaxID=151549 RepID=A0A4C1Y0U2_EUMVA|nr:hypothetical protein EVAR_46924_1 [Eumeta japonica]